MNIRIACKSQDKKKNNIGYKLMDICKNNNLSILNGQFGDDKTLDKGPSVDVLVIDYVIASLAGLKLLSNFSIKELDCLYSDGHSLLTFSVILNTTDSRLRENANISRQRPKWVPENASQFCDNIDTQMIHDLCADSQQQVETVEITQNSVDSAVSRILTIFINSSQKTFGNHEKRTYKGGQSDKNKPWFGPACRAARQHYHYARKMFNNTKTDSNKRNQKQASRSYKITMSKYIRKFKVKNWNKLRNMNHKRPKDFWKILNSIKSRKDTKQPALDDFYEYFKNINMVDQEELDDFEIPIPDTNNSNEILNQPIMAKEIEHA